MIKLLNILKETQILVPRRSSEERQKNYQIIIQKKIQQYIKDGSQGDLHLSNTPIQSLPNNLKVGGYLYLSNTPIQSLPNNLKVEGDLHLSNTPIQSLPNDLKVGGDLILWGTSIQSLPDNLTVEGDLILYSTPLSKKYTKEQLKAKYPNIKVKGKIYL